MYYLQMVSILIEDTERRQLFRGLAERIFQDGILCCQVDGENMTYVSDDCRPELLPREGENERIEAVLWITDSGREAARLLASGQAVLAYLWEKSAKESFAGVRYAFEEPEDLDADYLERVYRRYAGLPWDVLDTERCHLRETTEADVDAFYEIYKEPSVTAHMENLFPERAQEREYVRQYIEKVYGFYGFGIWTVLKKDTEEVIGRIGYSYRKGFADPELGFVIGVPWQGQGLAYEVCTAVLRYGSEELGFNRVQALVEPGNQISVCLCKKLGMQYAETVTVEGITYLRFAKELGEESA